MNTSKNPDLAAINQQVVAPGEQLPQVRLKDGTPVQTGTVAAMLQGVPYDKSQYDAGTALYVSNCAFCHGVPGIDRGGNIPNLGYSAQATIANLDKIVLSSALGSKGMPDFSGKLTPADVEKIKAFIQGTADAIRPK